MSRPSLRDVAALAGTSTAVVSYVINDGPRPVAPATRERVLQAIETLGYRPNRVARALRTQRTGTLGLVVPDLTVAFFAELAAAVEDVARSHNQRLVVSSTHFRTDRELEQLGALQDARVDGIIIAPSVHDEPVASLLASSTTPSVVVHRDVVEGVPTVAFDDFDAGRQAAQHLAWHGHRKLAVLSGPGPKAPVGRRTDGFVSGALAMSGGRRSERPRVVSCEYDRLSHRAYEATRRLLLDHPEITGLCATTDEHALGAMRAAAETGRRVGEDLALVSIDGTHHTAYTTPPLSVLQCPFDAMAEIAVKKVLTPEKAGGDDAHLRMRLVPRRSCGCSPDDPVPDDDGSDRPSAAGTSSEHQRLPVPGLSAVGRARRGERR